MKDLPELNNVRDESTLAGLPRFAVYGKGHHHF
jgi:hypothetical protein